MKKHTLRYIGVSAFFLFALALAQSGYAQSTKTKKETAKKETTKKESSKKKASKDDDDAPANVGSGMVYICDSEGAEAYHKFKDCGALGRCKSEVKRVTKKDAQAKDRKLCQICAKKD